MNRTLFHGWKDVFSFTFEQGISAKDFKKITLGIAIALLVGGMAISLIMAISQKKNEGEISPLEVVHVIDESHLQVLYLDGFAKTSGEKYPDVSFRLEKGTVDEIMGQIVKEADPKISSKEAVLHISETEKGYLMSLYLPENSALSKEDGEEFLSKVTMLMEQSKLYSVDIPMEKLVLVMSGISTSVLDAGEKEKGIVEQTVVSTVPLLFVLFLFLMTHLYGQSISSIVSTEKVSKLMEMMLTMTRPYALIMGKIFATACIGMMQMLIWVGSLVGGFWAGHVIAKNIIYSEYSNIILETFDLLKNQDGSTAFSMSTLVLAFLTACLGFLFYCVLAGMIASFADKAENLAHVMSYYQIALLLGYFGGLMVPMQKNEILNMVARSIPVTSAFLLPGDMVVGNVTVLESIVYISILLVSTIVLTVITGKIYKNQLFYKGTALTKRFTKRLKGSSGKK